MKAAIAPERAVMVVSDRRRLRERALAGLAREAAQAGADWFQLREKDLGGAALLRQAREVVAAAQGSRLRVAVNGRADVARAAGAQGVHLPEQGLPARDVRETFPDLEVGVSCHALDAARRAQDAGAHYVVLGPVFATTGKDRPLGLPALAEAVRALGVPLLAIGGITAANVASVWATGVAGVAAIGAFLDAPLREVVPLLKRADAPAAP
jgi:thiamine-phosphate pyrophosphorylase